VHLLHPAARVVARLRPDPCRCERDARGQTRKLALQHREILAVEGVADQVHSQVPALRTLISALDLGGDDRGVTGPDDPISFQPVQSGTHRPLGQIGVAD